MKPGRPVGSKVRQNMIDILFFAKKAYGYEIHQIYVDLFPKVTQRLIYYHLSKGLETNELIIHSVTKEKGNYSWGESVEKTYYSLGSKAVPKKSKEVKAYFDKKNKNKNK